jgi:hypothetical protein
VAELAPQRVASDLGHRPGQLDTGRPAADDGKAEPRIRSTGSVVASARSNAQDAPRITNASSSVSDQRCAHAS